MPRDPLKVVQGVYDAFGRGDVDAILSVMSADVDWRSVGRPSDYPLFGEHRGRAGVARFLGLVIENEAFTEFSPREFHTAGDVVLTLGHAAYAVRRTGRLVANDWAHVWRVLDGEVVSFREIQDTAQIAEAYRS